MMGIRIKFDRRRPDMCPICRREMERGMDLIEFVVNGQRAGFLHQACAYTLQDLMNSIHKYNAGDSDE